jgi:hypothetical protein
MKIFSKSFLFVFLFLCMVSCGYRSVTQNEISIEVPYIQGDKTGLLTNKLIEKLDNSKFNYKKDAKLKLIAKILSQNTEEIGFKHDFDKNNVLKKNVIPVEGREKLILEVSIVKDINRTSSDKENDDEIVWGPFKITDSVDFDYVDEDSLNDLSFIDSAGSRKKILSYSLGQLESIQSAKNASNENLYEKISKKIVDALENKW